MQLLETVVASRETVVSPRYLWDNANRGGRLEDGFVVQRTLSGAAFFEDSAGRRLVPRDHLMVFCHGDPSRYGYPPEAREPYALEFLHVRGPGAREFPVEIRRRNGPVFACERGGEVAVLLDEIGGRWRRSEFRDREHNSALTYALVMSLLRSPEPVRADAVDRARDLISRRYLDPELNTKEVAFEVGLTREHLTRAFQRRFGESPAALIERLRLDRARVLLRHGDLGIDGVARQCGLGDGNRLGRTFSRVEGHTPTEFRAGFRPRSR